MKERPAPARRGRASEAEQDLPRLESILEGAGQRLAERGEIGLISVTVLQRRHVVNGAGWHGYETIIREIGAFLRSYQRERMRREDRLFTPMPANTNVPPR